MPVLQLHVAELGDDCFANAIVIALDILPVGARIGADESRCAQQLQGLPQFAREAGCRFGDFRRNGLSAERHRGHQILRAFRQRLNPLAHQRVEAHRCAERDRVLRDLMHEQRASGRVARDRVGVAEAAVASCDELRRKLACFAL